MIKRKTSATIENHRGILRLRWNDGSPKRQSLNLHLLDSPATRALAKNKKAWIERDYQEGEAVYDRTLAKGSIPVMRQVQLYDAIKGILSQNREVPYP
jgi:hypothetical protein